MEKSNSQNLSLMGNVGANDECLFYPTSPNERMIQENLQKVQKGSPNTLRPPPCNSKIPTSNLDVHTETANDSVVNVSLYDSFSVDDSKYDSFDDSLDEEAHISPKRINVSNFLSEQVNVTVRKIRDRQITKGSNLCDSLEDICSLVSNAEHISTSDEIEFINNMLEKHGICEDSLRNDVCYDNRNASLNELNFDDDSLAILEVEKPFDDSLEDVDVASCVDSLMVLGNSIGDTDVIVDKLVSENCGGTRNLLETSVHIIYENAPISSDESFRTAENFNSNKNSLSLSDCPMSRDSLEEIHDISEIASSEKSLNIPRKTACDLNEPSPAEEVVVLENFTENVLTSEVKQTSSELSPTSQNRFSNAESERTSSVVNSCYFYDTFCMDDSVQLPPEFDHKESSDRVTDSNFLNESSLKLVSEATEKFAEFSNECVLNPSYYQDMNKNQTSRNADLYSTSECFGSGDKIDNICVKSEQKASEAAVIPFCDPLNGSSSNQFVNEDKNSVIEDSNLPLNSFQVKGMSSISDTASENEYCQNNADKLKVKVFKTSLMDSDNLSQCRVVEEHSKKVSQCSNNSVSYLPQKSMKNISTCTTVSPSIGKLVKRNVPDTEISRKNDAVENSKLETDQMNLKLHIELAINKNCDVNVVSVSSVDQKTHSEVNIPSEKSRLVANCIEVESSTLNNQTNQLKAANSNNDMDALEKIMAETHKKIPTLSKISEHENSNGNQQKLNFIRKVNSTDAAQIKLGTCDAQLLQALDLHDSSFSNSSEQQLQSRDSIMPLNLCIRDLSPEKKIDILLESKENIPYVQKCKMSPGDNKGTFFHSKNKPQGLKKTGGKHCSITKIPIRKAESPLSIPVNQKQIKSDFKSSPCGKKQMAPPIVKSASVNSIGKTCLDEMSKKHHFCTVRNSICRVPKSLEKSNSKKFQNIQSPVAKYIEHGKVHSPLKTTHRYDGNLISYIENGKVHSPLKTTHRYDGNLISTLPPRLTPKATSNASASVSEASISKKVVRRLKS